MKAHSIMTVPIVGISYKVKKLTTICKIKWINPCNGNIQVTKGIATCNPEDEFVPGLGEIISESRAKIRMYKDYKRSISKLYSESIAKHNVLIMQELVHLEKIKPSNKIKHM